MADYISRDAAFQLLKEHNKDAFHIQHAITVEAVMKWFAQDQGFGDEAEYWGIVGLLHDIDFEEYPEEHCIKAPELLRAGGVGEDIIHSVVSHGYGITVDVKPEHYESFQADAEGESGVNIGVNSAVFKNLRVHHTAA